jgi:predicted DNA-binding ribbon-helix-helix protein
MQRHVFRYSTLLRQVAYFRRVDSSMKSTVVKRSIVIDGHQTSISLEDAFWDELKNIAVAQKMTLSDFVGGIDSNRKGGNLSSAIRLYVLANLRARAERTLTPEAASSISA